MVTPETLTDEMVLALQDRSVELTGKYPEYTVIALAHPVGRDRRVEHKRRRSIERHQRARQSCCDAINANR